VACAADGEARCGDPSHRMEWVEGA